MCTHDCIYLDVYTWMRTHVCIDLDVYTWVYWRLTWICVHMHVCTDIVVYTCIIWPGYVHMYASTRAVNCWILQSNIPKCIAICIAIFSLISPSTWFTLYIYSSFALLEVWKLCLSFWNGHRNVSAMILDNVFNLEPKPKFRVLAYWSINLYWKKCIAIWYFLWTLRNIPEYCMYVLTWMCMDSWCWSADHRLCQSDG